MSPRFDEQANAWESIAPLPTAACCCACAVYGHIYVVPWGGNGHGGKNTCMWRYDPGTDTYAREAPLPLSEWFGFAAAPLGRHIYVVGGSSSGKWTGR